VAAEPRRSYALAKRVARLRRACLREARRSEYRLCHECRATLPRSRTEAQLRSREARGRATPQLACFGPGTR
jgi:hypothetical protein